MIEKVTASNFCKTVLESPLTVLVEVAGKDCGQCRSMTRVVELLDEANDKGDVKICILDTTKQADKNLAISYGVKQLPTFLFFKGGKLENKIAGPTTMSNIVNKLKTLG